MSAVLIKTRLATIEELSQNILSYLNISNVHQLQSTSLTDMEPTDSFINFVNSC